jgi:hypothetical protein
MNKQEQIQYATKRIYPRISDDKLFFHIVDNIHNRIIYNIGHTIYQYIDEKIKK